MLKSILADHLNGQGRSSEARPGRRSRRWRLCGWRWPGRACRRVKAPCDVWSWRSAVARTGKVQIDLDHLRIEQFDRFPRCFVCHTRHRSACCRSSMTLATLMAASESRAPAMSPPISQLRNASTAESILAPSSRCHPRFRLPLVVRQGAHRPGTIWPSDILLTSCCARAQAPLPWTAAGVRHSTGARKQAVPTDTPILRARDFSRMTIGRPLSTFSGHGGRARFVRSSDERLLILCKSLAKQPLVSSCLQSRSCHSDQAWQISKTECQFHAPPPISLPISQRRIFAGARADLVRLSVAQQRPVG